MSEGPERRTERPQTSNGPGGAQPGPLKRWEAYLLTLILVVWIGVDHLAVWFKLYLNQTASTSLINTINDASKKSEAENNKANADSLAQILKEVKAGQDKTDEVATQTRNIAQADLDLSKQQTDILKGLTDVIAEMKNMTTQNTQEIGRHTNEIRGARSEAAAAHQAARKAQIQTQKTQKEVAQPWYQRIFK
jgi:hypothetical protein